MHQGGFLETINNKKILFSHGDEIEMGNEGFKRYKRFISSYPLSIFADYIMPYRLLEFLGRRASKNSKKRRAQYPKRDAKVIKKNMRLGIKNLSTMIDFDIVLCGHTHIHDKLINADCIDKNGFFVGNHHYNLTDEISMLRKLLEEINSK